MSDPISDATEAEALLRSAISPETEPVLSDDRVARLLSLAESGGAWSVASLNRAAVLGWEWKAAAAASQFDADVGPGKSFELSQVYEHCVRQAARYANGSASVVGTGSTGTEAGSSVMGTIGLVSVAYDDGATEDE